MIIGITGGIGSGKSTIARELAKKGFAVYDCDREAKRIIAENAEVRKGIIDLLGHEAFANGQYNTAFVAKKVFSSPELLKRLNQIVHPAVGRDILDKHPDFVESAILFESGLDRICDRIIVVDAPEDVRIARTIARDYKGVFTPENIARVRARMNAQQIHPESRDSKVSIVLNDGQQTIEETANTIIQLCDI